MQMRFRIWLETAYAHTEPFAQLRQIQRSLLDKAISRGDKDLADEINTRLHARASGIGNYSDIELPDVDDEGNVIKPKPKPVDPLDMLGLKWDMYRANRLRDPMMAKSVLDDIETGIPSKKSHEDEEETNALYGLPPGSKVGVKLHKPHGSTHDTISIKKH